MEVRRLPGPERKVAPGAVGAQMHDLIDAANTVFNTGTPSIWPRPRFVIYPPRSGEGFPVATMTVDEAYGKAELALRETQDRAFKLEMARGSTGNSDRVVSLDEIHALLTSELERLLPK